MTFGLFIKSIFKLSSQSSAKPPLTFLFIQFFVFWPKSFGQTFVREAYKISAKLVNYAEKNKKKLNQLNFNELKKIKNNLNKKVMHVLDVRNSVNLKTSYGGTSTKNIKKMVSKLKREFK